MSQNLTPLGGGRKEVQTSPSNLPGIFISAPFLKAKKLNSTPTEWVSGGRPVYGRLPAASERYKVSFGFDDDSAYVYLPVGESVFGPKSLEVTSSEDGKFIVIKPGSVVWKYGQFDLDPVIIGVEDIGLSNSQYLFAYQFFLDDSPFDSLYGVESYNLRGCEMKVTSNTDSVKGWRYKPEYAFYGSSLYEWRNYDSVFPTYSSTAELTWQFPKAATLNQIDVRCPENSTVSGSATLYMASCSDSGGTGVYCQTLNFEESSSSTVQSDENGQFFRFVLESPTPAVAWKIKWSDPKVSVKDILISGNISLKKKPEESLTRISLVAYPAANLPPFAKDGAGNSVPAVYCKLAQVNVDGSATVTKITDLRESVNTPYQPVAEWLTRPIDEDLIGMYEEVSSYAPVWMDPVKCMRQEYTNFQEKLV